MPTPVEWLTERIPTKPEEDGTLFLRWTAAETGHVQEASVAFVADRYGQQIEQAAATGEDVLTLVLASEQSTCWRAIWQRWRELGFI